VEEVLVRDRERVRVALAAASAGRISARSSAIWDGREVGRAIHPSEATIRRSTAGASTGRSGEAACGSCRPPALHTRSGERIAGPTATSWSR